MCPLLTSYLVSYRYKYATSLMSRKGTKTAVITGVHYFDMHGMRSLGHQFLEPGPLDVICARGSHARHHSGNKRLRAIIDSNLEEYGKASTKLEKTSIVSSIVDDVREASPEGGFVRCERGQWYEVGDHLAREKIGQR